MKLLSLSKYVIMCVLFIAISSCHKDKPFGQISFYFNSSGPNATVLINGQSAVVSGYFPNSDATCGETGTANFTLPAGNYNYTASSADFNWSGTVTVYGNQCSTALLTQSYGNASFWISTNYPNLTVNIGGQSATITQVYTSGQPNDCATSGNANFTLPAGTYNYTAQSGTTTWSGTTTIDGNTCNLLHLN